MNLEELFKKKEEEVRAYGGSMQNDLYTRYGVLTERISKTVLEYLHEEGVDGDVDSDMMVGVYFAHCWSVARFAKIFDKVLDRNTKEQLPRVMELCLNAEDLADKEVELGKEGC